MALVAWSVYGVRRIRRKHLLSKASTLSCKAHVRLAHVPEPYIRLVGYRYDIVSLWWVEILVRQIPLFKRLKQLWPGQSNDALLVLSYQYCEFQSQGR